MTASPLVSVVVPVHDKVAFVEECLASIRAQTHDRLEVLCIDDGSTDGSSEVLARFAARDPRFRVMRNESATGEGAARNLGLDEARGEAIFFVDADDWIEADAIRAMVALRRETGAPLVRGSVIIHRPWGQESPFGSASVPDLVGPFFTAEGGMASSIWGVWSYLYDAAFLRRTCARFSPLPYGTDLVFLLDCLLAADVVALSSTVVYHYRQDPPTVWREPHHLSSEIAAHRRIRERLVAAGLGSVWARGHAPRLAGYFVRMAARGRTAAERRSVAEGLAALLAEEPHAADVATGLAGRLEAAAAFGPPFVAALAAAKVLRTSVRRLVRRWRRAVEAWYRGLPPQVQDAYRALRAWVPSPSTRRAGSP